MPSTVTKSIGTSSRDYSTLQAWEDAAPANLVTSDQIWRGEAYNDSEFTAVLSIAGETTDATRYVELTAATGQSFQDSANVRTNTLRYNVTNGVGLKITSATTIMAVSPNYTRFSRFQITGTGGGFPLSIGGTNCTVKDCIFDGSRTGGAGVGQYGPGASSLSVNVLVIANTTNSNAIEVNHKSDHTFIGCTLITPSNLTNIQAGFRLSYSGTVTVTSCAVFGFNAVTEGAISAGGYNATEKASGFAGTNNVYSVTYSATTPFTQAAATGTLDFRAIAATSLAAAGSLDSTNAPNDISGAARATPPTIGAWELAAASIANRVIQTKQAVARAAYW